MAGGHEASLRAKESGLRSTRQRRTIASVIRPFARGSLDRLCGLYAGINAIRLIAEYRRVPLSEENCLTLFRHGIRFLDKRGKLLPAVRYGMGVRTWHKLVGEIALKAGRMTGDPIELDRPFAGTADFPKMAFVTAVGSALDERKVVLLLLDGQYEHFTVVFGLTETRLRLFDSFGYRWITLAACTTEGGAGQGRQQDSNVIPSDSGTMIFEPYYVLKGGRARRAQS